MKNTTSNERAEKLLWNIFKQFISSEIVRRIISLFRSNALLIVGNTLEPSVHRYLYEYLLYAMAVRPDADSSVLLVEHGWVENFIVLNIREHIVWWAPSSATLPYTISHQNKTRRTSEIEIFLQYLPRTYLLRIFFFQAHFCYNSQYENTQKKTQQRTVAYEIFKEILWIFCLLSGLIILWAGACSS